MNIIEEYSEICDKYSKMKDFLTKRAKAKDKASENGDDNYCHVIISDGNICDISCGSNGEYIWLEFTRHTSRGSDETTISLTLEELTMSDEEFTAYLENKYAENKRDRERVKANEARRSEEAERATLKRLLEKYPQ